MTGLPLSSRPAITGCRSCMLCSMSRSCLTICWIISWFMVLELCSARLRNRIEFFLPGSKAKRVKRA